MDNKHHFQFPLAYYPLKMFGPPAPPLDLLLHSSSMRINASYLLNAPSWTPKIELKFPCICCIIYGILAPEERGLPYLIYTGMCRSTGYGFQGLESSQGI